MHIVTPRCGCGASGVAGPIEVKMRNVVHVTHEAVEKIGGIGTVLEGLLTSGRYQEAVGRSILIGPLFTTEGPVDKRLGPDGQVLY